MSKTTHNLRPIHALVVAAGSGSRFGGQLPKQYTQLFGKTILEHSIARVAIAGVMDVTVVVSPDDEHVHSLDFSCMHDTVYLCHGGEERFLSVQAGVLLIRAHGASDDDWVMIHDGARATVPIADVNKILAWCHNQDAQGDDQTVGAILAIPVVDTLKQVHDGSIIRTISRDGLYLAQTPQVYRLGSLISMLDTMHQQGELITDESAGFERLGYPISILTGTRQNLKLTYADDLPLIRHILMAQMEEL